MNKSTPIAQLPNNNIQSPQFVNDQQRQIITQAQQAISNNTNVPQNTQLSSDIIMNDDDAVVQDILNQINSSNNTEPNQDINQLANQQLLQHLAAQTAAAQQQQLPYNNINIGAQMQQIPNNQFQPNPFENLLVQQNQPSTYATFLSLFVDDAKLAVVIFTCVIIAHFIPLEKLVGKYIALDKIPYHNIIFRAIVVTLFVIIIKKLSKI